MSAAPPAALPPGAGVAPVPRPRGWSISSLIGATLAVVMLLFAAAASFIGWRATYEEAVRELGLEARAQAVQAARAVDTSIGAMARYIVSHSRLDQRGPLSGRGPELARRVAAVQGANRDITWLGIVDPDGMVLADTDNLLRGRSVAQRSWFGEGKRGLFVGDVHEAILLAKLLPQRASGSWRFVDVVTPLLDADGAPVGVLAAHLSWDWIEGQLQRLDADMRVLAGRDLLVIGPDGSRRFQSDATDTASAYPGAAAAARAERAGWRNETRADGQRFIVGYAANEGVEPFGGLGWVTMLAVPDEVARAQAARAAGRLALLMGAAALLIGLLAYAATRVSSRPIEDTIRDISSAADRIARGQLPARLSERTGLPREFRSLREHVDALVDAFTRQREELQYLFDVNPAALSLHDLETQRLLRVNPGFLQMVGRSHEQLSGVAWGELVAPGSEITLELIARELRASGAVSGVEIALPDGEGRRRNYVCAFRSVSTSGLQGVLGTLVDISERKRIESSLHEARLAEAAARAGAEAKSRFLANMSHEIRTPLNGILGFSTLLEQNLPEGENRQHARCVRETGETLARLLNDILDLAKIEAGKLELDAQPFRLAEVVESAARLHRLLAQQKGLAFVQRQRPADDAPALRGDALRLRQIIHNLLSNAVKFTPAGEVSLDVSQQALDDGMQQVQIQVRDSGIGIDAARQTRLFEDFTQADASISSRFGGTGLGLGIVRRLAQAMGGDVQLESAPGQGALFSVTLRLPSGPEFSAPAAVREADASARVVQAAAARPLHLLVVDDVPMNLKLMQALLGRLGHRVSIAGDGEDALRQAARERFDLIFMDVDMPVLDGYQATRRLRAGPGPNRDTPVVALTGFAYEQDVAQALAHGMTAHLAKPIQPAALEALLARLT